MRPQISLQPQKIQQGHSHRQLQQKLRPGGEAEILFLFELLIIIQKTDGAVKQREQQHKQCSPVPPAQVGKAHGQNNDGHGGDEDHAAHGRSARLRLVPVRTYLTDLLPRFDPPQPGDVKFPHQGRNDKAEDAR